MKKGAIVAISVVGIAAVLGIALVMMPANNPVKGITQALQQTADQNATDSRTLAEGQDEDSKTQVKDIQREQTAEDTEQFTVQTFTMAPQETKRIIFQTSADAESAKMQGKVTVQGPGVVTVSIDREHCELCGPYYVWGDSSDAVRTANNGIIDIPLKANAQETLVIKNNANANQTISLNLEVVYQTKA